MPKVSVAFSDQDVVEISVTDVPPPLTKEPLFRLRDAASKKFVGAGGMLQDRPHDFAWKVSRTGDTPLTLGFQGQSRDVAALTAGQELVLLIPEISVNAPFSWARNSSAKELEDVLREAALQRRQALLGDGRPEPPGERSSLPPSAAPAAHPEAKLGPVDPANLAGPPRRPPRQPLPAWPSGWMRIVLALVSVSSAVAAAVLLIIALHVGLAVNEQQAQLRSERDRLADDQANSFVETNRLRDKAIELRKQENSLKASRDELLALSRKTAAERENLESEKRRFEERVRSQPAADEAPSPPPAASSSSSSTSAKPKAAAADPCDALASNPNDMQRRNTSFGVPYPTLVKDPGPAIEACAAAVARAPGDAQFAYQYGRALAKTNPQAAERELLRATAMKYAVAYDNLAQLALARKDISTAYAYLQRGIALNDPDSMITLADLMLCQDILPNKPLHAAELYVQAADAGHSNAFRMIAETGRGLEYVAKRLKCERRTF